MDENCSPSVIAILVSVEKGDIEMLFRLHVWLPDGQQGAPGFGIHSHQPFAQSWVLAGECTKHQWAAKSVGTREEASHSRYTLALAQDVLLLQMFDSVKSLHGGQEDGLEHAQCAHGSFELDDTGKETCERESIEVRCFVLG
jgi:hypothetical protein